MVDTFNCPDCGKEFSNENSMSQHKVDAHQGGLTKHEIKELKKQQSEEKKTQEASAQKTTKLKKNLMIYGGILAVLIIISAFFLLSPKSASSSTVGTGSVETYQTPRLGAVGSEHTHQDFKIYIEGKDWDFSLPKYQVRARHVHVEGGDGDVIHKHATGVTVGYFLDTVGWKLTNGCLTTDQGNAYCNSEDKTLKFYLNGQNIDDLTNYEMRDLDKFLISYGSDSEEQIQSQLSSITNKAPIQSGSRMVP